MNATYVLPVRLTDARPIDDLATYLRSLSGVEIIVVDGSSPELFSELESAICKGITHVSPDPRIRGLNGKVRGVLSGLRLATHDKIVVGDDDVRYDHQTLDLVIALLDHCEVVRPQNYFSPKPWHAVLDEARSLVNRALDGDWPGTLAFRKSALPNGYNADVLFENFELIQTIRCRGGREVLAKDVFVARRPPTARQFWHQRVRQAYDEFARPRRLVISLGVLPLLAAVATRNARVTAMMMLVPAILAGVGWKGSARRYFSGLSVIVAPLWMVERACSSWLAVLARLAFGGMRYGDTIIKTAATPSKVLEKWCA